MESSDGVVERVSNSASTVWIVLSCFSIGSSDGVISPLYLSNASSSGAYSHDHGAYYF